MVPIYMTFIPLSRKMGCKFRFHTSGDGQRCEFVLGDGEAGAVVRCNSKIIPCTCVEVKDAEVGARLDVVRHLNPLGAVPVRDEAKEAIAFRSISRRKGYAHLLSLVLDHEVRHPAAAVLPRRQLKSHLVAIRLDEFRIFRHDGLRSLGARVQNVRCLSGANAAKSIPTDTVLRCTKNHRRRRTHLLNPVA